jgi:hypothetical protein
MSLFVDNLAGAEIESRLPGCPNLKVYPVTLPLPLGVFSLEARSLEERPLALAGFDNGDQPAFLYPPLALALQWVLIAQRTSDLCCWPMAWFQPASLLA